MEHIITTFAHGNGPYSRSVELALAVNKQLDQKLPIIVPLVYGDRQKEIMTEQFGDVIKENPNLILLDEFYGEILHQLFFKTGHYQENLEFLLENQPKLEERLRDYLAGTLKVKTFNGKEKKIKGGDVAFEVSHNPRVATGYDKSFYTTIAFFSEILQNAIFEKGLDFDPLVLVEVKEKIAAKIEKDKKVHFMPEPFVFSYMENRGRWNNEIFTPPFVHEPRENNEDVAPGMYVTVTGIDGLRKLFEKVDEFGMTLYCPPFIRDIENADGSHNPEFVANPNIKYQFGRTGWSTVWLSHMSETPLITPAYSVGDDPEIYFNEKTVKELGLAAIFDKSKNPEDVLREADSLRAKLKGTNQRLVENYGTLDGIDYTAKVIVDSLEGKDLSKYREVEPVLSKNEK